MQKFKGLIFDFNGVLLLDQHVHDAIWQTYAVKILGRFLSDDEIKNIFHGRTTKGVLEHLYGKELAPAELESYTQEKELAYQKTAQDLGDEFQLAPGAISLFELLEQKKVPFTIATSSPTMNIGFYNDKLHLDTWFDMNKIAYDDGTVRGKPAPDLYLRGAQMLSLPPAECVVIEDARSGIEAARAAGIGYIIAIGPKDRHPTLRTIEGVNGVIEQLNEVDVPRLF